MVMEASSKSIYNPQKKHPYSHQPRAILPRKSFPMPAHVLRIVSGGMRSIFLVAPLPRKQELRIKMSANEAQNGFFPVTSGPLDTRLRLPRWFGQGMSMAKKQAEGVMDSIVPLRSGNDLWNLRIKNFRKKSSRNPNECIPTQSQK